MQKLSVPAVNKTLIIICSDNYIINKYYILKFFADLIT